MSNCLIDGCTFPNTKGRLSCNLVKHIIRKHSEVAVELKNEMVQYQKAERVRKGAMVAEDCVVTVKLSRNDFLKGSLDFIVLDGRPFSIFDDSGFLKITQPITQAFQKHCHSIVVLCKTTYRTYAK